MTKHFFGAAVVLRSVRCLTVPLCTATTVFAADALHGEGAKRPILDRFGQVIAVSYADKITDEAQLRADLKSEVDELASYRVPARDAFGGAVGSGKQFGLKATGFFHLAKAAGHDVFVTPSGNAFFQLGVCALMPVDDYTYVEGREDSYEWLPPREGDFASAWLPGGSPNVSFYLANWIRKYGRAFDLESWSAQYIRRLRAWGFNSGGAWTRPTQTGQTENFPYARVLLTGLEPELPPIEGIHGLFDPFMPGAERALDQLFAERIAPEKDNPLVIGYFLGNEQLFENVPKVVPRLNARAAAKRRLVAWLRDKYAGDLAAFRRAWDFGAQPVSFEALADLPLPVATKAAAEDLSAFTALFIDTHYRIITEAFRRHDRNHLLIGSRWQPGTANNETLVRTAARYVDVISVNYYTYAIEKEFLERVHAWSGDRPLLLSEWYYSCSDTGLRGGKEVANQRERGLAYRNYVENTAVLPYVVGHQWFTYLDQSATGRYFQKLRGEASNTGLVNVVDRPYREFLAEAVQTNARIYDLVLGHAAPFQFEDPRFAARSRAGATKVVDIPRAEPGMIVDGVMSHWPGRPGEPITGRDLVVGSRAGELSADFRLCWDDERLYVFVQVRDATPAVNRNSAENLWRGDGIELFIGPPGDGTGGLLFEDRHLVLGGGSDKPDAYFVGVSRQPRVDLVVTRNVAGDGYALEAGIPWNALGVTPRGLRELRLDVGINDSADGSLRERQLMWNGTARNSGDRSAWGRARLLDH
jgi:hypothetical protein